MAESNGTKRIDLSTIASAFTNAYRAAIGTFSDGNGGILTAGEPVTPREPEGQATPLQYQFNQSENLSMTRRRDMTPFEVLRSLADNHDLTRIAIEVRKEQISGMVWDIVPADKDDKNDYTEQVKLAKEFFKKPDRVNTFYDWIGMVLEEVLVVDALTLYRRRTRGGQMFGLDLVDGSTIKPLIDSKGRTPLTPLPAYQQVIYGYPQGDYTIDQLIYKPKNRRVHTVYGFSPVEYVMLAVNIALRRERHYLSYYTEGSTPDGGLYEVPESWTPAQIKQYQEYWEAMLNKKRHSLRFVPKGGYHATKDFKFESAFDEWLARLVANAFGIDAQVFSKQQNKATAQSGADLQTDIGLKPLVMFLQGIFTDVLQEDLGFDKLCFKWIDEKAADEALLITKNVQYVAAGIYSRDEVRVSEGRDPSVKGGMPAFIMKGDGTPLFLNEEMYAKYKAPPDDPVPPAPIMQVPQQNPNAPKEKDAPKTTDSAHTAPKEAKPTQTTTETPKNGEKALYDELRQWEKFAISRFGKSQIRPFEVKQLPTHISKRLQVDIELAESVSEIKQLFKDATNKPYKSVTEVEKGTKILKKG